MSRILFTGGWGGIPACIAGGIPACLSAGLGGRYPSLPCRFPDPHPGGRFRGSGQGVSRPTPNGEVERNLAGVMPGPGGVPDLRGGVCGDPLGWLGMAVRILLECILVFHNYRKLTDLADLAYFVFQLKFYFLVVIFTCHFILNIIIY